eukprot:1895919-Alexandrium_andersonii.AAC.1
MVHYHLPVACCRHRRLLTSRCRGAHVAWRSWCCGCGTLHSWPLLTPCLAAHVAAAAFGAVQQQAERWHCMGGVSMPWN